MIHEFKNNHWLPGPDHRDGNRPFPANPRPGLFFNDVTGAQGDSADAVAEQLPQLLMKQGALAQLLPAPLDWSGFMTRLQGAIRTEEADREFARVLIRPDETAVVMPDPDWGMALAQEGARLAMALVRANGQMDFIRRQPWFKAGTHRVVLVLEQQFGRSAEYLQFHQDTSGDALFSNLIFRNAAGLPAPEWSPNLQPMPNGKRTLVSRNWPPELLTQIEQERARLGALPHRDLGIEGGTLPADGFVSWLDELVWHTTPVLENRPRYSLSTVEKVLGDPDFDMTTYDVLVQIVQTPGSRLAARLASLGGTLQAFSSERAEQLWTALHTGPEAPALQIELLQDAHAIDWEARVADTAWAMPLIRTLPDGTQAIVTQPSGLTGRPRRNSDQLEALKADPGSAQTRSFMQVVVSVQPVH